MITYTTAPWGIADDKSTGYYNILIRDYHNTQREIDYLQHNNGVMKRELEEIKQSDIYKLRAELRNMESQLYSMFEKMQEILKATNQHDKDVALIAAAPDMLAMLKRVFKVMPSRMEEGGQLLEGEIAALINKVEGA